MDITTNGGGLGIVKLLVGLVATPGFGKYEVQEIPVVG